MFIVRDENNKDTAASEIIDDLKSQEIFKNLQKNGMTVTDIKRKKIIPGSKNCCLYLSRENFSNYIVLFSFLIARSAPKKKAQGI